MTGKLRFWVRILIFFTLNYFQVNTNASAQSTGKNKYGLFVIEDIRSFIKIVDADTNKRMADIRNCLSDIILDLKYATTGNFMHQQLYFSANTTYLRKAATGSLRRVLHELGKQHLTLKIFDAYRPYSVTEKMWEAVHDHRYAADPAQGSGHNRGAAVDVSLVDIKTKNELDMGTAFDNFSDTAHNGFTALPVAVLENRNLLKTTMEKHGFVGLNTEWWHFSLSNASSFELLNLDFDELQNVVEKCNQ